MWKCVANEPAHVSNTHTHTSIHCVFACIKNVVNRISGITMWLKNVSFFALKRQRSLSFKPVLIAVCCSTFSVCRLHFHPQRAMPDMAEAQLTLLLLYF